MRCVFWNVGRREEIDSAIVQLVEASGADLLVLAEYTADGSSLIRALNDRGVRFNRHIRVGCDTISIFADFPSERLKVKAETSRYTLRELALPNSVPVLFAFVHLQSKLHADETTQAFIADKLRRTIEEVEESTRNRFTIVLGDFNMNPFDKGMITASALHAVSSSRFASKGSRTVLGSERRFFYNPCWSLLGDREEPPGTYFYSSSQEYALFWHTFDQVILRPSLLSRFNRSSLRVHTAAGETDLLSSSGRPKISDHLPISFEIDLLLGETHGKFVA